MCPECHSFCCLFHTSPCLTHLFHRYIVSHHFRCDLALSVFASKCQGECHAWTAALYDLGILAGGIPGFCIELCCFVHPLIWPLVFLSCFGSSVSCGLLAPDTWKCKRAQVSLKATIDIPMLGTIIEQNGDGLLEDSHMPVGWPLHIDGAVRQCCIHRSATLQVFFSRPTPSWLPPGRYTRSIIAKDELRYTCKAVRC